jgi:hypothetical protein
MKRQIGTLLFAACTALLVLAPMGAQTPSPATPDLTLTPTFIPMGTFYNGAKIAVKGRVAAGSGVVVAIRGPEIEETFNKKGKVGPFWYNAAKVHISGAPSLFLCYTSGPLTGLLSREALDAAQLDEEAIRAQMKVQPPDQDNPTVRENYLALKRQQSIYRLFEGTVKLGAEEGGSRSFTLDLAWPKKAPPAAYEVKVYECRDQGVTAQTSTQVKVEEVGFPARLAQMANTQAYLYGLIAVLAAVIVGFGIDFLASKLGKKGVAAH